MQSEVIFYVTVNVNSTDTCKRTKVKFLPPDNIVPLCAVQKLKVAHFEYLSVLVVSVTVTVCL